ncbi:type II toxin-antitoxin system ParD family antitoxin [Rubellimicrobium roseum]|uniref:Type II toxin-antitoxin system ParD family antitoxin n=1 Tax=Rubellimicrobium roseum TaxID=687525 RepID=A0A5C4N4G9_9RHOB|nr:type II toxin-antitoxin system ParD family antitoxin [Rubellimicrobium roseum]TNC59317.1 type II toxin-antitoxin system ParD family antitoxin [Rubellimicrobium roseum]
MTEKHYRHIALTESLTRFIQDEVAAGRYTLASEVVRAGLRLLIEREDAGRQSAHRDE